MAAVLRCGVEFYCCRALRLYCTFGFRETIFLGIIEFYPGYGGFVTFESELVPKLVSELVSDNYNMRYRTSV